MANLTLTGYNSQYSNLTFIEKRDMEKGFKDSAFRLNNSVKSYNQWTETESKARQKELQNVFMRLWPMPTTSFEPLRREAESASLDDGNYEFTDNKRSSVQFNELHAAYCLPCVYPSASLHLLEMHTLYYTSHLRERTSNTEKNGFRELRAMIMVDEAHQFHKKDFNSFRSIISEGRMFGVGMILSTQNVSDFKTSKEDYSQFILSWVIHHVNSISKAELANIFGASDPNSERYMDFINKAKLFESVCKIGSRVDGIRDLPFFELIKDDER